MCYENFIFCRKILSDSKIEDSKYFKRECSIVLFKKSKVIAINDFLKSIKSKTNEIVEIIETNDIHKTAKKLVLGVIR